MLVRRLHPWDLSPTDAVALQRELSGAVDTSVPFDADSAILIAGVDCSSTRFSPILTAGVVVWNAETGAVVATSFHRSPSEFPYIPGLLSFREIPVLVKALEALPFEPDLLLVDGQGIAHPRGMGIAAHMGLLVTVPTVGVAKSRLCGENIPVGEEAGDEELLLFRGKRIGTVLRSKRGANPLYVSPGNGIDMESSIAAVRRCLRGYRLPEPTRLAHLHVHAQRVTHEHMVPTLL